MTTPDNGSLGDVQELGATLVKSRWSRLFTLLPASPDRIALVFYGALYATSAGVVKLAGFLLFLWLARTLSVHDYGTVGLFYSLQSGITMIGCAGIVEVVVGQLKSHRSVESQQSLFATANAAFAVMAVSSSVLAFVGFAVLVSHDPTDLITLVSVLALGLLLAFATMQAQIVRLQERHPASVLFASLIPLAGFVGGFVFFLGKPTVPLFFGGMTAGTVVGLIALRLAGVGFYGTSDLRAARTTLSGVAPFVAIAVLGWLSGYGNNYFVRALFPATEVARFTFALMLSSIMQLAASALNQVWSPRFFRIVHEMPEAAAERRNRRAYQWQAVGLGLTGGTILAVFPSAMRFLGGNLVQYSSMRIELLLMVVTYVLLTPWWHCYNYFLVHEMGVEVMHISVVTSILGIAAWIALMWTLGPIGVYVGFMTQMLLRVVAIVASARRKWPVRIAWEGVAAGTALTVAGVLASVWIG